MNSTQFDKGEREMREKHPKMFSHTESRSGEIHLCSLISDVAVVQVVLYQEDGLTSARLGEEFLGSNVGVDDHLAYYPIFASLVEVIEKEEKQKPKPKPKNPTGDN